MPDFLFDDIIERKNTDSLKYDFATQRGRPEDILPLWVADMDFKTPSCIIDALTERSQHGIFGYSESGDDYINILKSWFKKRFNWDIHSDWLVKTPGVVFAIAMAIRALTNNKDAVMIQEPVYYPFRETIETNDRTLVVNELRYNGISYTIDFDAFERQIIDHHVRLFILCSPHNPVGRVWTSNELERIGEICRQHRVLVVSDEIHADFVYPGHEHIIFSNLKSFGDFTITCTAPTKTFNLAGLQISNIFIPNPTIHQAFRSEVEKSGYSQLNIMGIVACKAAYSEGEAWLAALKEYLTDNLAYLRGFLHDRLPQVKLVEPDGTYLVWLDFRSLGLNNEELEHLIVKKANLWLDGGGMFGPSGMGFQRLNIACPRATLSQALLQLERAVNEIT